LVRPGYQSEENPASADTAGATRRMVEGDGGQPGDPAKAAAAIRTALAADSTPLRLPLGGDSVDAILGHLDAVRDELTRRSPGTPGSTAPEPAATALNHGSRSASGGATVIAGSDVRAGRRRPWRQR
jgi:hypothetical protein